MTRTVKLSGPSNFVQIIEGCQNASGAGSKAIIQVILQGADPLARDLITAALDPYQVFGVKQFEMPGTYSKIMHDQQDFAPFLAVLEKLAAKELTGDAARSAVTNVLKQFNIDTQQMLARVIDKDLRAGFSADSANKAWKKAPVPGDMGRKLIPTFEVMLADKCDSTEEFESKVSFPCQADFKYDGQRTIAFVRLKTVTDYRARSGKPMDHLINLFDDELERLREHLRAHFGPEWADIVTDGEAFASDFTETINAKKAGNDKAKANLKYRLFFVMPLTDWTNQSTTINMRRTREILTNALKAIGAEKLILSEGREVVDYQDMMAYCNEVIDVHKQEGLILKDWDAVYEWTRSFAWTKVKRFYDVDCKVVGFYLGKKGTKNAKRLGGIKVWGRTEDGTIVESDCGSGFSDPQRDEIWQNQEKYLGATVVIKYQEVTKSKSKTVASLRFPTFEHFRDDKTVE